MKLKDLKAIQLTIPDSQLILEAGSSDGWEYNLYLDGYKLSSNELICKR